MMLTKQRGVALPLMLLFLALITLVVGRINSLAGQQRGEAKMLVWRSQANTMLLSAEDMVLRKLPLLDIPLFHRLRGEKEDATLTFMLPLPQGEVSVRVLSANQCLNLAPLWEDDIQEKYNTGLLLQRLLDRLHLTRLNGDGRQLYSDEPGVIDPKIAPWVCYLPGAGQHWDRHQLTVQQLPLLTSLLPDESPQKIKQWLTQGISPEVQRNINLRTGRDSLISESHYYWLDIKLQQGDIIMHSRELVHIVGRTGHIIRRRLLEDNAP